MEGRHQKQQGKTVHGSRSRATRAVRVNGMFQAHAPIPQGLSSVQLSRDTIEYNLRANDPTSLRRKAREWGVTYDNDETEAPVPPVPPTP